MHGRAHSPCPGDFLAGPAGRDYKRALKESWYTKRDHPTRGEEFLHVADKTKEHSSSILRFELLRLTHRE